MPSAQWWTCLTVLSVVGVTLTGLLARGMASHCWSLSIHLALVLACGSAILLAPEVFWSFWFFMVKETLYAVSRVLIALELGFAVFRTFPGALRRWKALYLLGLIGGTVYIGTSPAHLVGPMPEWHSRVGAATIFFLAIIAVLVEWYMIPLHRLHRAVLIGFTLYLLTFTTFINALSHWGYYLASSLGKLDALAYLLIVAWWGLIAWKPSNVTEPMPQPA